jgi:hypothetical protein
MPFDPVEELINRLTGGAGTRGAGVWPPKAFAGDWDRVRTWRAFLENDRERLRKRANWTDASRPYKIDPLPERMAEAWADHLWGEDPTITAAGETTEDGRPPADAERLAAIIDANELADELRTAETTCVGEGEVWWRIAVDEDVADVPLIEWHSRLSVAPLFIGRRLAAAALVSVLQGRGTSDAPNSRAVYRHFEIHADERVEHVVFRGTNARIGRRVELDQHPETEDLDDIWEHGLPMLMGRIVNRRGRRIELGKSEFDGIDDLLLELNEAVTIGGENMRLTAKKRAVVDESVLTAPPTPDSWDRGDGIRVALTDDGTLRGQPLAQFPAGDDILVSTKLDKNLGEDTAGVFKVLEYSYDAEALIAHKRDLVETILTRRGLTPQWVGVATTSGDGYAVSGTHLRLRMIPTDKAGRGKARPWDDQLPRVISLTARVDALPVEQGGFGAGWDAPDALPAIERANPLPVDEVEDAQVTQALISARVMSRRSAIKRQHPDWDQAAIDAELEAIDADQPATVGLGF